MKKLIIITLLIIAACKLESGFEIELPKCHTPMPVFTVDELATADSLPALVCPYGIVDEAGDTTVVIPDIGELPGI